MKEGIYVILGILFGLPLFLGLMFGLFTIIEAFSGRFDSYQDKHLKENCERAIEYHLHIPSYCTTDYLSGNIQ